jgi:hypothetical protein
MDRPDTLDIWRKDFVAMLRMIGAAAARLRYGVPEPALGGQAAIELYSGGLWPTRQVELLTTDPHQLEAELLGTGFRRDECSPSDAYNLWHPTLDGVVSIVVGPPVHDNVVAAEIGATGRNDATTIRVVGIEDLIVHQISGWLRQGGRRSEIMTLVQVLVELGRVGVGGPFRSAYLQRRLARETAGEVVLESSLAPDSLDDPAPRTTSLTSIASLVRSWRARRNLSLDAADLFGSAHRTNPGPSAVRKSNKMRKNGGVPISTAQIIQFRPHDP